MNPSLSSNLILEPQITEPCIAMSLYTDNPLQRGHAQIRLLKICAGPVDKIRCTFETFEINQAPSYQALSYEWGPNFPVKVIEIVDRSISIRLNLWVFLSKLKYHGYHGYLWCDAICIDQTSDHERNHQVQLMNQIYQKAERALVWLGEADVFSSSTFAALQLLTKVDNFTSVQFKDRASIWEGLLSISKRKYWTRVWIIQEITVARNIKVFCGSQTLSWSVLATATKFPPDKITTWAADLWTPLPDKDDERQIMRRNIGRQLHHSIMYRLMRAQRRWPRYMETITDLCARYKESECEDRRDRIFALLKISKEVIVGREFAVDYKKDTEATFYSLIAWAGAGTIALESRLQFANQSAESLSLDWKNYLVESKICSKPNRSPVFFKWINQPLKISLPCKYLGACSFVPFSRSMAKVKVDEMRLPYKSVVYISQENLESSGDDAFELFGFEAANILLVSKQSGDAVWEVQDRAFYQFGSKFTPNPIAVHSVFKRLSIVRESYNNLDIYSVQLQNFAQLMEILLDKLDPSVWLHPWKPSGPLSGLGPSQLVKKEDKLLEAQLRVVTITQARMPTRQEEQQNLGEDNGNDSIESDCERLQAISEILARPRIQKPPLERHPKQLFNFSLVKKSPTNVFLDPFCERPLSSADRALSTRPLDRQLPLVSVAKIPTAITEPSLAFDLIFSNSGRKIF